MNIEIREYVEQLLNNYQKYCKQIALLRYELSHAKAISHHEMIESMFFSRGDPPLCMPKGHVSDKTYYIAMNYRDKAENLNRERNTTLIEQLIRLERHTDRLKHSVLQLDPERRAVIQGVYFEGKGYKEIAAEMHLSERTVQRYKDIAIAEIEMMYEALFKAGVDFD